MQVKTISITTEHLRAMFGLLVNLPRICTVIAPHRGCSGATASEYHINDQKGHLLRVQGILISESIAKHLV
jgi:hypothetical protein